MASSCEIYTMPNMTDSALTVAKFQETTMQTKNFS